MAELSLHDEPQPARRWVPRRAPVHRGPQAALPVESWIAFATVLAAWEIASHFLPPFLFPSLATVATTLVETLRSPGAVEAIALTYARILVSLALTFAIAGGLGIWAAVHPGVDRAIAPLVQLKQGVPAVCWAIFAIIWFKGMEPRVFFVVAVSTFPTFFYQLRDGVRAIPADLWSMVRAWRPSRWHLLRKLLLPSLVPSMLVAWRINLGNGARITVTAELLAGVSGIGHFLRESQEQFRMDAAIAWTVVMAVFVLSTDFGMGRLERRLLAWRQNPKPS
jgi:ABC-type nitrate/sulfonate/bicarbonate transport system permease component